MVKKINGHLSKMANVWRDCKLCTEPMFPLIYMHMLKVMLSVFMFSVPFDIVSHLGLKTVLAVFILALGYFSIDAIASELEDPFGKDENDVPVVRMSEWCEASTRQIMEGVGDPTKYYDQSAIFEAAGYTTGEARVEKLTAQRKARDELRARSREKSEEGLHRKVK